MEKEAAGTFIAPTAKPRSKHPIRDNIVSLGSALLIVFAIRSTLVESFKIPSGSMIPTLAIGDYLFVNKFAYGFKVPFTDMKFIPFTDTVLFSKPLFVTPQQVPARGDIIVFRWPRDETIYFIKRVIGIPGDTIELKNKELFLNGKPVPRDLLNAEQSKAIVDSNVLFDPQYTVTQPQFYKEHLPGKDHIALLDAQGYSSVNFGPITVPQGAIFAMGDNRDVSNDSRFWGFVPLDNIAGKAALVWMSVWMDFSTQKMVFHLDRIGTILH